MAKSSTDPETPPSSVQDRAPNETTPLVFVQPERLSGDAPNEVGVTPLPRAQLVAIYAVKLTIVVAGTQVLPYLNKMTESLEAVDPRSVGYYSGLLGTSHTLGQIITIFFWGRLSDWVGRMPVITLGLAGLAVSVSAFGVSKTFLFALLVRCLTGVFSGFIGVIHSVVGELSDKTNQSTAFPFYDIVAALGFIIGPLVGGAFAEPAVHYPQWFDTSFYRRYPYFLPSAVASTLTLLASLLTLFYLSETHPRKQIRIVHNDPEDRRVVDSSSARISTSSLLPPSIPTLLTLSAIQAVCVSQWMLGFLAACFNTVFVLMSYTPIESGGLSLNPRKIALALSVLGVVSIGLKASLPVFLRRYGALAVYRSTLKTWPLTFALMPALSFLAIRVNEKESVAGQVALWAGISVVLFMSRVGCLAFSIVMILTKEHTPSSAALGATNGLSELAQMIGIAVGASFISFLFTYSSSSDILGGYWWAIVIVVLAGFGDASAGWIAKHST